MPGHFKRCVIILVATVLLSGFAECIPSDYACRKEVVMEMKHK